VIDFSNAESGWEFRNEFVKKSRGKDYSIKMALTYGIYDTEDDRIE
jgi:hypothetical protein